MSSGLLHLNMRRRRSGKGNCAGVAREVGEPGGHGRKVSERAGSAVSRAARGDSQV